MINPLTSMDYPDPDVIRVNDTYYMVTTTMYYMPGCEILRSFDLIHWEHLTYVYDTLDSTPGQRLEGKNNCYSKGMWAGCIRYHKEKYYICFCANDTHKTYLFTADQPEGPWKKQYIDGFYHDSSLLFDDDGRIYIIYGNKTIYLTELNEDLSGPKPGGRHNIVIEDTDNPRLGFEGSHIYKIHGRYYAFFIHSLADRWMRAEACYTADSLDGPWIGGDVLVDDMGYMGSGVAQGGIVQTSDGLWYGILFQDRGAVGRIPVLVPVTFEKGVRIQHPQGIFDGLYPVFGVDGRVPVEPEIRFDPEKNDSFQYMDLAQSDDFTNREQLPGHSLRQQYGTFGLKSAWQFNHEPWIENTLLDTGRGEWKVSSAKICENVTQAPNTITQRMYFPECAAEVTVDGSQMKDGDVAGLCALQYRHAMIALKKEDGRWYAVMNSMDEEKGRICLEGSRASFRLEARFDQGVDSITFFLQTGTDDRDFEKMPKASDESRSCWKQVGTEHKVDFDLRHFTGCRIGLAMYAAEEIGGSASFSDFRYYKNR